MSERRTKNQMTGKQSIEALGIIGFVILAIILTIMIAMMVMVSTIYSNDISLIMYCNSSYILEDELLILDDCSNDETEGSLKVTILRSDK